MNELECDESSAIEWFECNIEQALKTGKTGKAYNASIAALKWKKRAEAAKAEGTCKWAHSNTSTGWVGTQCYSSVWWPSSLPRYCTNCGKPVEAVNG